MKIIIIVLSVLALTVGFANCGGKATPIHKDAISDLDSRSYDVLLAASITIDQVVFAYSRGELPAASKNFINMSIAYYNVARTSWLIYRTAVAAEENGMTGMNVEMKRLKLLNDIAIVEGDMVLLMELLGGIDEGRQKISIEYNFVSTWPDPGQAWIKGGYCEVVG